MVQLKQHNIGFGNSSLATYSTVSSGTKIPVVYLHGNCQNHTAGIFLMDFFESHGHPVFSLDFPGHGNSPPSLLSSDSTIDSYCELLNAMISYYGIKELFLAGHSFGGMVGLQYATKFKDRQSNIKGLIALGTASRDPIKDNPNLDYVIRDILIEARRRFRGQKLVNFSRYRAQSEEKIQRVGLRYTNPQSLEDNFKSTFPYDVTSDLEHLPQPLLIIRGEKDQFMSDINNRGMSERVKRSVYITLEDTDHNFHLNSVEKLMQTLQQYYGFLMA